MLNADGKTFFYDWGELTWRDGNDLITPRNSHVCGYFQWEHTQIFLVAGGIHSSNGNGLKSVEIMKNGDFWETGPALPNVMTDIQMVSFERFVILLSNSQDIYRLNGLHNWLKLDRRLSNPQWVILQKCGSFFRKLKKLKKVNK